VGYFLLVLRRERVSEREREKEKRKEERGNKSE
jgi:hypothetical protein